MENDVFELENTPKEQDYERTGYGKIAYKRVQRLRRKGRKRGIEVPPLGYELHKPEKPRIAFWIVAIVSAVLFIGIIVGIGFLFNELIKTFSDLSGISDFLKVVFDPAILSASFGWSALPGILFVAVYMIIGVIFLIPIIAAIYFCSFVRDAFYMAKCSKEEFAHGSMISSRIFGLIVVLVTSTVIFAILMSYITAANAKVYMGLIFAALAVALGGLLALIVIEKIKSRKWFESLEEENKQNYLAHERALRRVKRRLQFEKDLWTNWGK